MDSIFSGDKIASAQVLAGAFMLSCFIFFDKIISSVIVSEITHGIPAVLPKVNLDFFRKAYKVV